MILKKSRRLAYDLETDGLLDELTRIHILVIKDVDTRESWVFRRNDKEDNILDGVRMLNEASVLIGHNIVGFDNKALWKVYGDVFAPAGKLRDTLVMVRMLFSDEKERDFRRWRRGELEGKLIGSHELKAWGQRLGEAKGDYAEIKAAQLREQFPELSKEEINRLVWAEWNQEMEDYAVQDIVVTDLLWQKIEAKPWPEYAVVLEHRIHDLMERVQQNGFPFDQQEAVVLETDLRTMHERLSEKAKEHFGSWWAPTKWLGAKSPNFVNPATGKADKNQGTYHPRAAYGEDDTRDYWGEVQVPARSVTFKDKQKGDTEAGCPFTPIKLIDFNPNSRTQIINRLQKVYGWEPQEFTEEGNAKVDDDVLRDLAKTIDICEDLAEIFYYSKRLGQLVDGKNGWIGKAAKDGKIHARTNVGGTVTNRASHSNPNIAQVPRVVFRSLKQWEEDGVEYDFLKGEIVYGFRDSEGVFEARTDLTPKIDPKDGKQIIGIPVIDKQTGEFVLDELTGKIKTKKTLLKGRAGDHGWDCRNLFYVPDGFDLLGADQKGIELRALGHYMAEFDGGEYLKLVVESDPHDLHQKVMELDSRDTAKTAIYAMIYGAQDYKLGITCDPTLAMYPARAKALGAEMRRRLMTRIPALGQVIKNVQREARNGHITGLDGRPLYVRGRHSALNTKLQGAAATVAKLWCVKFEELCEDEGFVHGWDGDFAILAWIHDEMQTAVRSNPHTLERVTFFLKDAARLAGEELGFRSPVDIDVKPGKRWSDSH